MISSVYLLYVRFFGDRAQSLCIYTPWARNGRLFKTRQPKYLCSPAEGSKSEKNCRFKIFLLFFANAIEYNILSFSLSRGGRDKIFRGLFLSILLWLLLSLSLYTFFWNAIFYICTIIIRSQIYHTPKIILEHIKD